MIPIGSKVIVEGSAGIVLAHDPPLSWPYVLIGFPNGAQCRYNATLVDIQLVA